MSAAHDLSQDDGFKPIGLGHNSGKNLREILIEQHATVLNRASELLGGLDRLPDISDDDTAGKVTDFKKQITTCVKTLEALRVSEKDPFLVAGREVDGVFNGPKDKLEKGLVTVNKRLTVYLNEKARIEREAREAEERARAEVARRAEEDRRKAEAARREAEERARRAEEEARLQKERAEREAREAAERHARELAEAEARAQAEEAKRRQSDASRERAQEEAARLRREASERAERERVEAEARAKREAEESARRAEAAREEQRRLAEEEEQRRKAADEAEARRIQAEKAALAKPADMARTRSDLGSVATLRRKWVFAVTDKDAIDLNQLRVYISAEAFDKAVNAAIRNGVRPDAEGNQPLAGIRIYEISEAA